MSGNIRSVSMKESLTNIDAIHDLSLQVALPDGRIQYVKYTADGNYGGTTMEVSYTGEARHPEHSGHSLIHESSPI